MTKQSTRRSRKTYARTRVYTRRHIRTAQSTHNVSAFNYPKQRRSCSFRLSTSIPSFIYINTFLPSRVYGWLRHAGLCNAEFFFCFVFCLSQRHDHEQEGSPALNPQLKASNRCALDDFLTFSFCVRACLSPRAGFTRALSCAARRSPKSYFKALYGLVAPSRTRRSLIYVPTLVNNRLNVRGSMRAGVDKPTGPSHLVNPALFLHPECRANGANREWDSRSTVNKRGGTLKSSSLRF